MDRYKSPTLSGTIFKRKVGLQVLFLHTSECKRIFLYLGSGCHVNRLKCFWKNILSFSQSPTHSCNQSIVCPVRLYHTYNRCEDIRGFSTHIFEQFAPATIDLINHQRSRGKRKDYIYSYSSTYSFSHPGKVASPHGTSLVHGNS